MQGVVRAGMQGGRGERVEEREAQGENVRLRRSLGGRLIRRGLLLRRQVRHIRREGLLRVQSGVQLWLVLEEPLFAFCGGGGEFAVLLVVVG